MPKFVTTPEAYRFWQDGALALSEVEAHGVRIDRAYLLQALDETADKIAHYDSLVRNDPNFRKYWQRRFGDKANTASPDQLSKVVFQDLGYESKKQTTKGSRDAADRAAFDHVDLPLVHNYFAAQVLRKARDTYLVGILREAVQHADGYWYVHPSYWLNTVISSRSSCSQPNWQNIPARNPEIAEMIRRCYIPRPGNQIIEMDYGQVEVRTPCCYCFDPVLIEYVCNPKKDMHRDMGAQIFQCEPGQVSKQMRHLSKNGYVFPTFYGSYYLQCAQNIWPAIQTLKLEGTDTLLVDHLRQKGITKLGACDPDVNPQKGSFEKHLKGVEEDFWGRRFMVYADWKRKWWASYQRHGGFQMLTGFAVNVPTLDKKQVCNLPIQGTSFHYTLWSLIRINRKLRKYDFRSRVIGEIHDSIVYDADPRERDDVIDLSIQVMTKDIAKHWSWLNVPLVAEAECCPVDRSWYEKSSLIQRENRWVPGDLPKWEKKYGSWETQNGKV